MDGKVEKMICAAAAAWVDGVRRRAALTLGLLVVATLGVTWYAATHLTLNSDLDTLFSQDLPSRVLELERRKRFPYVDDNILIVVDGATMEKGRKAAEALAERMRKAPESFREVYLPRDRFFEDHALLYMGTGELEDLADRLARVQPYLAALAADGSLRGLANILERAVAAVRDGETEGKELPPMFERVAAAIDAEREGRPYNLSWAEVIAGRKLGVDERRYFVIAQPVVDFSHFVAGRAVMETIKGFISELGLDHEDGVRVRVTGDIALNYEEMNLVDRQATMAGVTSFLMVTALLVLALRSARLVLATVVTLLMGLATTMGFAAAAVGQVNVISIAFAVLFIGLGVDFGIHFCLRYQELSGLGRDHQQALAQTAASVGSSILLCALTTAIGFYAFLPTDFSAVAELGLIAGTGMFIGTFFCFTALPAAMSIGVPAAAPAQRAPRAVRTNSPRPLPMRHPRSVSTVAIALGLGAVLLLPQLRFDNNPLRVRDPSAESVQALEEIIAGGSDSPWDMSAVASDLAEAEQLAARLRELDEVSQATTVKNFVPADQDEKLAIMEDVSMFMAPPPSPDGSTPHPSLPEQLAALASLRDELGRLLRDSGAGNAGETAGEGALLASARELRDALDSFLARSENEQAASAAVNTLESGLLGSLPGQLRMLDRAINAGPVELDKLPPGLLARMISADGMAVVKISPREDLNDNAALKRFVAAVLTVAPEATGSARTIYEHAEVAVGAFREALGAAVVAIVLLLLVIWRTVGDTLLVLAPLLLASVLTAAAALLVGIPFNFADIIVLPLLLGMGVDSGIHLVHRARSAGEGGGHLLETSTARAVLFSSLTTIASFGSLALASHRGMATLGQLLAVGIGLSVLCNLLFLPAFIELHTRWKVHGTFRPLR